MPVEVILPKVDMDMTHGTLAAWHVAEGATVVQGAALFDIETDKAAMEVEAPASGRLGAVTARPGDRVAVGTVVAMIYAEGEAVAAQAVPLSAVANLPAAPVDAERRSDPVPTETAHSAPAADAPAGPRATPAARAAARAAGISLDAVAGTGPQARIQRDDVAGFLRQSDPAPPVASAPAVWTPGAGPLHVSRRAGSAVPVVLIHGFTADSQSWAPLEKALGPARPLIRIDLPCHGKSPNRRIAGFAELARMVIQAFDEAMSDADEVHVVGHSLGGALALALADIRTRRVASLSLIAPAGLGPEIDAGTLNGIVRASRAESLGPWLRRLTATPEGISDDYVRAAMRARSDAGQRAAQAGMAEALFPDGVQAFDLRPALSRLDCPMALIWGRQDHILPYRQALAVAGDFGIHLLPGAGHIPQIECPDRVARILTRSMAAAEVPA